MFGKDLRNFLLARRVKITVSGTREEDAKRCATNSAHVGPNLRKLLPINLRS